MLSSTKDSAASSSLTARFSDPIESKWLDDIQSLRFQRSHFKVFHLISTWPQGSESKHQLLTLLLFLSRNCNTSFGSHKKFGQSFLYKKALVHYVSDGSHQRRFAVKASRVWGRYAVNMSRVRETLTLVTYRNSFSHFTFSKILITFHWKVSGLNSSRLSFKNQNYALKFPGSFMTIKVADENLNF